MSRDDTNKWVFPAQRPSDVMRNSITGEFFATEGVKNLSGALVRESLQNSLDARLKGSDGAVTVRIRVATGPDSLPPDRAKRWFRGLWRHVDAERSGIKGPSVKDSPCPYISVEDFGTTGLTGDYKAPWRTQSGDENNFLGFFRSEGDSNKGAGSRGSWGIGKAVFPRASHIYTFFGLTIPDDSNKALLMGRSILRFHEVDGQHFTSDGYRGEKRDDGLVLPTTDPAQIQDFTADFRLCRTNETGLSVVIPYVKEQGADSPTYGEVKRAVLEGYYFAILRGKLRVWLLDSQHNVEINRENIIGTLEAIEDDAADLKGRLLPYVRLAEWGSTCPEADITRLPPPGAAPSWSSASVPNAPSLAARLQEQRPIAIRAPVSVRVMGKSPSDTHFDIFMEAFPHGNEKSQFVREDLLISDLRRTKARGIRALVHIEDKPLSDFLKSAENPAHTNWSIRSGNFSSKAYVNGQALISYVVSAPSKLAEILNGCAKDPDRELFAEFFPDLVPQESTSHRTPKPGLPQLPDIPPPKPRAIAITKLQDGFHVGPGDTDPADRKIRVQVAYNTKRKNPFTKYDPLDFDLAKPPITITATAARLLTCAANQLLFHVEQRDFSVSVTGFDRSRDLIVRADLPQAPDAS